MFRIVAGERDIALALGENIIGRSADAAVFVDDSGVSRHHARITVDARGATLEDLEQERNDSGRPADSAADAPRTRLAHRRGRHRAAVPDPDDEHVHRDDFAVARRGSRRRCARTFLRRA